MKKSFLRVMAFAVIAALVCIGCSDDGVQNKNSEVGEFINMFANGGGNVFYTLTINVSPADGGTVSRGPNADSYAAGTRVTVTASPNNGYTFLSWSGAQNSTNAEIVIVMNGDKALTAGFNDGRQTYDVYFNANGASGGAPTATRAVEGKSITLPDQASMEKPGYSFIGWTENSNGTGNIYEADFSYTVTRRVTLYAKWVPIYTVTFNTNNATGDAPAAVTADSGTAITLPTRGNIVMGAGTSTSGTRYVFGGWSTNSSGVGDDYAEGAEYTITGNVTLYARWIRTDAPQLPLPKFDGNGNTRGEIQAVALMYNTGTVVTLPGKGDLEKDGYYFDGWCTNRSCTETVYQAGDTCALGISCRDVYYAKWVALPNYTVTFNGNGNTSGNPPTSVETYSGNNITLPEQGTLVKTGYRFDGWSTDNSGTGTGYAANSPYTVTGNVTLYAKWTAINYTVTFDGNGMASGVPEAMNANYGNSITLPAMTRTGYNFVEWNTNSVGTGTGYAANSTYSVTDNVTLYARWTTLAYTITFNGNATTSGGPAAINANYGNSVTLPSMTRTGYTFGGWYENSDGTGTGYAANTSYTVTDNVTLYAKWTAISYTVTFNGNGATSGVPAAVNVNYDNSTTLPSMTRTGCTFDGWNTNNTGTGTNYAAGSSYTVTGNVTLYANWTAISYTVTFDGNGATSGVPAAVNVNYGSSTTLPSMTRTGYTFGGWNTNSSGTGTNYAAGSSYTVTSNVTLYAKWTVISYTVTFNGNGATSGVPAAVSVNYDNSTTLPSMTRTGYTFGGWNTNSSGTGTNYAAGSSYTVTGNVTLYAKWTVISYTVTFDGNGAASGVPAAVSVNYGSSTALPSMTRTGYTFGGWNTNSYGSGIPYAAGSSYTVTGNVTLYAMWAVDPNTVVKGTFTDNRNSKTYKTVTIGNQRWMAENLNYVTGNSWCYDDEESNCVTYGRLYTWAAAKTVCPSGWKLPDTADWRRLVTAAGGSSTAGIKLKNVTGWNSYSGIVNTNDYGFSALPGGRRDTDGTFNYAGDGGYWWTATEGGSGFAYLRPMLYSYDSVLEGYNVVGLGFSVRCVQD